MILENSAVLSDTVLLQVVDDETILLDTQTEEYFSLNEVGSAFYQLLKEESKISNILEILVEHFQVPEEELKKDLFAFIEALAEKGLLKITT